MTDYLSLAQQRAPEAPEEQDNPYMPLAQQQQTLQQNRARTVIETALRDDPDIAAERLRVSQTSGVPLRVVERNLEELRVKERARAIDLVNMAKESPVLYRQITDPTFATTSVDDLDTLKNLERSIGKGVRYTLGADGKGGLPSDLVDAVKTVGLGATVGVGKMAFDVAGTVNDLIGYQSGAQAARGTAKRLQGVIDKYGFQAESSTGQGVKAGLQSAGTNLALLPIGLIRGLYSTANQAASTVAGLMATSVGAAAFNEAREQGRNQLQAGVYAIPEAAFEFVFERIPAAKLFGDLANNTGLLKLLGRQTISEGWTEQLTTLTQDFNQWMNLNPDKTLGEFIQERPEAAYQTFIATLVGVGVQTSTIKGINTVIEKATDQSLKFDQDLLESQMQLAASSMLRTRSPEQFRAHVQRVVEGNEGAKQEIYVDAEVLNQLPPELLAQLPESVREALPGALETNSTVAIPMADVLTVAPGTDLEQILNDNARMRPNSASRVEAQLTEQYLQQEAERVLQQAADTEVWQQSSEQVKQAVLTQLNSTGRFTPDVNDAYATLQANFFSTMAARVGMTPQELYDRYALKVAAQPVGQGGVLNAGEQARNYSEFDRAVQEDLFPKDFANESTTLKREIVVSSRGATQTIELPNVDSNGRQITGTVQGLENFWNFYGDGPVDEQNRPVLLYHSTNADITEFETGRETTNNFGLFGNVTVTRAGIFASPNLQFSQDYLRDGPGGNVMPVYMALQNPLDLRNGLTEADESTLEAAGLSPSFINTVKNDWSLFDNDDDGKNEFVDALKRAGYDGAIIEEDSPTGETEGGDTYIAFDPTQIKSAVGNRGTFDPTDANILNQSATLRSGKETLKKYGLKPGGSYKTREVAAALEARQRAKYGLIAADDRSPQALANISKWMAAEVEFEMANPEKSGVGWYSEKFQRALDTMAEQFPELATDKVARDTMTALIAITSDGQKVVPNFAQAMDIYGNFKATGQFTTTRGTQRQASVDGNLAVVQRLYDLMGPEAMHEYLMQEKTISELKKIAKANGGELKSDYQAHIKMPMAAVEFGPKLGAFYANLMGAHGYLTMDRWWSRSFNRYRGTLLQAPTRQGLDRFKELLGNPALSDDEAIAATVEPRNAYEAKGFKNGTELEKAANTIYKAAFENLEDAPFNATDRTFMLDAVDKAQKSLSRKGYNLSVADIQAILWYYEKRLYGELGARQTADISYEEAARRVVAGYAAGSGDLALQDQQAGTAEDGGPDATGIPVGEDQFVEGDVNDRLEQAGDGAGRRTSAGLAPLEGAPAVPGFNGPDPRVVAVAEQYARDNGIDLKRQSEYVQVDPERAARIAAAYEAMPHSPQDPAVREAYENLIAQTLAQYRALEAAGYKFWFMDLSREDNQAYASSPWNAMRDMRANQQMGVFPTTDGFGTSAEFNPENNPLFADTGLQWPVGGVDGELKPVLANDLFRAVHDAFGHGMEGAGFRAQGEENAWQAHARLFTGSAVAAITTETRGQNSWLNFGPFGEQNQTAKVEDTVFADQKTGLLPEFAWTEGRAGDMQSDVLEQGPRGTFSPSQLLLTLNENADLSTFLHESGHFFLEVMADLASQANTPQQIKDDMAATLEWFGVPDLATWNSYTLDEKRPYHERWAESFEQYLFEGKAPSPELQPLFRRFRSWMVNVYKSLTEFMRARNLKVNDEVRQVFGRLIATDEQIAQAEEAAGMLPDFDATNEAIEQLQARSLRDLKWTVRARGKVLKALEKEAKALRKDVEAEVRAEVEAQPLYRAMNWLKKGETIDPATGDLLKAEKGYRLLTTALAEMYPETMLARPDLTRLRGMTGKEGLHPDMVADMFGYETGDQLVRAIIDAEPIGSVIEGMTDQRMLERHGDLATPEALEAAANEAVHNEARAKSLATELKGQAEMLNPRQDTGRTDVRGRPITVNAITNAAKQFAANLAARRRIKDLKNAAWQHRSAEARAGKRWQEATSKGQTQEAVQAKRDQVLNNAAVKALQDAQVEVRKILEFFKRVTKGNDEKVVERGRDPDVVNAMRAILGAYDVAPRLEKTALAYMETVAKNDPVMYAALQPSVQGALLNAKPLTEMTMEELRGLNDELRAMWALAKSSRQMEIDGNLIDIEEAADQLVERMGEIGIPDTIPGERGAITDRQERGIKLQFAKAILSRVEQWSERLDGKFGGPFLRLVFQPVKDAADRYRTDKVAYRKKFTELVQNVAPALPAGPIDAPELGYTFGNARDSGAAELMHAILHTGNDSNKRKLLLGRGWATQDAEGNLDTTQWDAFIQRMQDEGKLAKVHYDFAQGVWDLLEEMKPLAQETHRKVFGRYFAEVTANEVVTPFGTYRGGYLPAQTDSRLVKDAKLRELAEGENESMAYAFPAAPSGFTKSRVEYNQPLLLDLRALAQHMDKVLLFSHMQGAVTDVRRLLTNKRVSYALDRIDPGAYEGMLIPWLNRSARQVVETPTVGDRKLSRFLSAARSRAGMALMFANLSNTAQQITGFTMAGVKVKPGLMMSATARFMANPKEMKTTVAEASPYMKDRMLNEVGAMNDAIEQILIDPTLLERGQAWTQRHAYFMQAAIDNVMSPIIWTAGYNQSIEQGMSERDAVRFADGVIRQTQGTTLPEDISRFESGPAAARVFTQFIGYFNMMANTNATAVKQITDEMGLRKGAGKVLYVALAGLLAPIWVAEAIAHAFRGGPEDEDDDGYLDDWLMAVFGLGTIRGLTAQVPLVGQAAQLVVNRFNDNPADDKFSLSPAVSLIESTVAAPASVYDAIVNDGNKQKAVRDVAAAATMLTGLPIYGVARPLGYLAGIGGGNIEPTGPADLARGLVTGTASPESKQR
jgi:hypothetical protein